LKCQQFMITSRLLVLVLLVSSARGLVGPPRGCRPSTALASQQVKLEDRDVPEAHRGLHDALYGDGEDHGGVQGASAQPPRDDGRTTYDIAAYAARVGPHRKVCGVYVVRDVDDNVRYVGASRDVALAVDAHRREFGPEVAATVRVVEKSGMARRDDLEKMKRKVLQALPDDAFEKNFSEDAAGWARTAAEAVAYEGGVLTAPRHDEYDSKKRKLQAAMAVADLDAEKTRGDGGGGDALRDAVESDDWSAVIEASNAEAASMSKKTMSAAGAPAAGAIVSPFASQRLNSNDGGVALEGAKKKN